MKLLPFNLFNNTNFQTSKVNYQTTKLAPMGFDTVSFQNVAFTSMKKSEFNGIDLAVVNKFKAPIEKFTSKEDFNTWCREKINIIKNKDYKGRQPETIEQRKYMLEEWFGYVLNENDAISSPIALLILDGITKDLEYNNDTLPPVLNKRILADTLEEIRIKTEENKNLQINFNKLYQMNLQNIYLEDLQDEDTGETKTGWIVIPSKQNDPDNFEENVDKLKILSHRNWCTKSFNARPYLEKGDFHIYLESGKPKIGIRLRGKSVAEIQGERNNSRIPVDYLDEVKKYIKENRLRTGKNAKTQIETANYTKGRIDKARLDLQTAVKSNDIKSVLEYFGIEVETNKDGTLTLSDFYEPDIELTYKDLGLDEDEMFQKIKEIKADANFQNTTMKSLGKLTKIHGNAHFENSGIKDLGSLQYIGRSAYFRNSKVTDLNKLKFIGKNANFEHSEVTNLGSLESIGEYVFISSSKLSEKDFEKVKIGKIIIGPKF